jgi:ADP-ribosylglycohydrolase
VVVQFGAITLSASPVSRLGDVNDERRQAKRNSLADRLDSLEAREDFDERDLLGRFINWWQWGIYSCTGECFDIGITTRQALVRWQSTKDPHCGSTDPMSAGNGSLSDHRAVSRRSLRCIRHSLQNVTDMSVAGCLPTWQRIYSAAFSKIRFGAERRSGMPVDNALPCCAITILRDEH